MGGEEGACILFQVEKVYGGVIQRYMKMLGKTSRGSPPQEEERKWAQASTADDNKGSFPRKRILMPTYHPK